VQPCRRCGLEVFVFRLFGLLEGSLEAATRRDGKGDFGPHLRASCTEWSSRGESSIRSAAGMFASENTKKCDFTSHTSRWSRREKHAFSFFMGSRGFSASAI